MEPSLVLGAKVAVCMIHKTDLMYRGKEIVRLLEVSVGLWGHVCRRVWGPGPIDRVLPDGGPRHAAVYGSLAQRKSFAAEAVPVVWDDGIGERKPGVHRPRRRRPSQRPV